MGIFDQLRDEAGKLAGKASDAARRAQLTVEIDALRSRMERLLVEAGEIAVALQRRRVIQDARLKDICADLAPMESRLQSLIAERDGAAAAREPEPAATSPPAAADAGPLCPNCGHACEMDDRFCKQCGEKLSACTTCGQIILASAAQCPHCGTQV